MRVGRKTLHLALQVLPCMEQRVGAAIHFLCQLHILVMLVILLVQPLAQQTMPLLGNAHLGMQILLEQHVQRLQVLIIPVLVVDHSLDLLVLYLLRHYPYIFVRWVEHSLELHAHFLMGLV